MKRLVLFFVCALSVGSLSAMVRAGVDLGPDGYYDNGSYYEGDWYGPGVYYGTYYTDAPTYYSWRRRYGYGGPSYWRYRHHDGYHHGHNHGGHHH